jgi:hypothetical protein
MLCSANNLSILIEKKTRRGSASESLKRGMDIDSNFPTKVETIGVGSIEATSVLLWSIQDQ